MFSTLLESRAERTRRPGGSLLSIVVHVGVIAALLIATANASVPAAPDDPVEQVRFTKVDPVPPVAPPPAPDQVYSAAPRPKGFDVLIAPIDIPSVLPAIDLTAAPTNEERFTGRGMPGGSANGTDGGAATAAPVNGVYSAFDVEKPVMLAPGATGPSYPETLRAAGLEGSVLAQFVVDTTGRADVASFTVLRSDHPLFTASVRAALSRMRFLPAEVGGRKVRQLVQQPFQFSVAR